MVAGPSRRRGHFNEEPGSGQGGRAHHRSAADQHVEDVARLKSASPGWTPEASTPCLCPGRPPAKNRARRPSAPAAGGPASRLSASRAKLQMRGIGSRGRSPAGIRHPCVNAKEVAELTPQAAQRVPADRIIVIEGPFQSEQGRDDLWAQATIEVGGRQYRVAAVIPGVSDFHHFFGMTEEEREDVRGWFALLDLARCSVEAFAQTSGEYLPEVNIRIPPAPPSQRWMIDGVIKFVRDQLREYVLEWDGSSWVAQPAGGQTKAAMPLRTKAAVPLRTKAAVPLRSKPAAPPVEEPAAPPQDEPAASPEEELAASSEEEPEAPPEEELEAAPEEELAASSEEEPEAPPEEELEAAPEEELEAAPEEEPEAAPEEEPEAAPEEEPEAAPEEEPEAAPEDEPEAAPAPEPAAAPKEEPEPAPQD